MAQEMKEDIDFESLQLAALLHDIHQPFDEKENHVEKSIELAKHLLNEINHPPEKTTLILQIIAEHSSEDHHMPSTLEAKILYDADKLDGIGATGIARVFTFCGQNNLTPKEAITWYRKKINTSLPHVQTPMGKKLLKKNLEYVQSFLKKYEEEQKQLLQ
jgi:uncharacterized protein